MTNTALNISGANDVPPSGVSELDQAIARFRQAAAQAHAIMSDGEQADPTARPRAQRRRTLLKGKLSIGGGAQSWDCLIRDVSETGAKIGLTSPDTLPPRLWLLDISNGVAFEVRIAWRRGLEAGVAFLQSRDLAKDDSLEVRALRRLWLARMPGG